MKCNENQFKENADHTGFNMLKHQKRDVREYSGRAGERESRGEVKDTHSIMGGGGERHFVRRFRPFVLRIRASCKRRR
jgi:hypothetical protein